MKMNTAIMAVVLIVANQNLYAGGDNQVTMTDMKEALYNLVIYSDKQNLDLNAINMRVSAIEPVMPVIEKNKNNISQIIERINELGIPLEVAQNAEISNGISQFVESNKHLLSKNAQGIR